MLKFVYDIGSWVRNTVMEKVFFPAENKSKLSNGSKLKIEKTKRTQKPVYEKESFGSFLRLYTHGLKP